MSGPEPLGACAYRSRGSQLRTEARPHPDLLLAYGKADRPPKEIAHIACNASSGLRCLCRPTRRIRLICLCRPRLLCKRDIRLGPFLINLLNPTRFIEYPWWQERM